MTNSYRQCPGSAVASLDPLEREAELMRKLRRIMKDIRGIVVWLDDGARSAPGPQELMEELCSRLAGAGIPLERATIFVTLLHPDIAARTYIWRRGQPVELGEAAHDLLRPDAF